MGSSSSPSSGLPINSATRLDTASSRSFRDISRSARRLTSVCTLITLCWIPSPVAYRLSAIASKRSSRDISSVLMVRASCR